VSDKIYVYNPGTCQQSHRHYTILPGHYGAIPNEDIELLAQTKQFVLETEGEFESPWVICIPKGHRDK
jgi:hypothetical protein